MASLRRAVLFASGARYIVTAINLATTIVLARLLTPTEFGITVLGTAVLGIAEALRELGSIAYLVQERQLTKEKIRTVFTISLIVTLVLTAVLLFLCDGLAGFYGVPALGRYIRVVALSFAIAPFAHPVYALLSRDMAFDKVAMFDITNTMAGSVCAVALAMLGFSYMSVAWGGVTSAIVWTLLGLHMRRDFSVYRPCLSEWRSVLAFGLYGSATAVLYRVSESLFYLMLGRVLDARAAGLCQRAIMLTQFPERVVLAGVGAVALPGFSDHARSGQKLQAAYLMSISYVTAVLWPALLLLAMLAHPIVAVVLGRQWQDVVPLVQIFALSHLFNFPTSLNYPLQVAVGAIRNTVPLALVQAALALSVLGAAASYGLWAVALSTLFALPLNVALSVWVVRRHLRFRFCEFAAALRKSALLSLICAAGPGLILLCRSSRDEFSLGWAITVALLFAAGWLAGLRLTRHPLLRELNYLGTSMAGGVAMKLRGLY